MRAWYVLTGVLAIAYIWLEGAEHALYTYGTPGGYGEYLSFLLLVGGSAGCWMTAGLPWSPIRTRWVWRAFLAALVVGFCWHAYVYLPDEAWALRIYNLLPSGSQSDQQWLLDYERRWWHFVLVPVVFMVPIFPFMDDKWFNSKFGGALSLAWLVVFYFLIGDPSNLKHGLLTIVPPILIFISVPYLLILKEYLKEHPLYRKLFVLGRGGSARFGGIYSFIKYHFTGVVQGDEVRKGPIYAGMTTADADPQLGTRHIGLDSDSMMLTVAAMGGGKSYCAAWNTLQIWPGGAFVLDPKGEHWAATSMARTKFGRVYAIAPWSDFEGSTFNPLDEINMESPDARDELDQIVQACLTAEPKETANSKHFRENAQTIMLGVMAHVLSTFDRSYHKLPCIYDTLLTGHPDGGAADPEAFDELLAQMAVNDAFGRAPMDAAKLLTDAGPSERGGFLTTVTNALRWVNNDAIRPILMGPTSDMRSHISMHFLRTQRHTVYLVVPFEHMGTHARFLRVVVTAALLACRAPAAKDKRTLFLLDEFPQLGTFKPIQDGLVTLRSRKVKIWMMLQDVGQLRERYDNWQDFMSSCDKQFFAVNDVSTAQEISKLLGEYVDRSDGGERRKELRTASEVSEDLRKGSGIQYVLPSDGAPLRLKLTPFAKNFPLAWSKVRDRLS